MTFDRIKKPLSKGFDRGNYHLFLTYIQTDVEETALEWSGKKKLKKPI